MVCLLWSGAMGSGGQVMLCLRCTHTHIHTLLSLLSEEKLCSGVFSDTTKSVKKSKKITCPCRNTHTQNHNNNKQTNKHIYACKQEKFHRKMFLKGWQSLITVISHQGFQCTTVPLSISMSHHQQRECFTH